MEDGQGSSGFVFISFSYIVCIIWGGKGYVLDTKYLTLKLLCKNMFMVGTKYILTSSDSIPSFITSSYTVFRGCYIYQM